MRHCVSVVDDEPCGYARSAPLPSAQECCILASCICCGHSNPQICTDNASLYGLTYECELTTRDHKTLCGASDSSQTLPGQLIDPLGVLILLTDATSRPCDSPGVLSPTGPFVPSTQDLDRILFWCAPLMIIQGRRELEVLHGQGGIYEVGTDSVAVL